MAKPILVTSIHNRTPKEYTDSMVKHLQSAVTDYNHLVVFDPDLDFGKINFQAYNVQDYPEIDLETLKQQLLKCQDNTESTS